MPRIENKVDQAVVREKSWRNIEGPGGMVEGEKLEQKAFDGEKRVIKANEEMIFINIAHYVAIKKWKKIEGIALPFKN